LEGESVDNLEKKHFDAVTTVGPAKPGKPLKYFEAMQVLLDGGCLSQSDGVQSRIFKRIGHDIATWRPKLRQFVPAVCVITNKNFYRVADPSKEVTP
jgi:hypothetical protein